MENSASVNGVMQELFYPGRVKIGFEDEVIVDVGSPQVGCDELFGAQTAHGVEPSTHQEVHIRMEPEFAAREGPDGGDLEVLPGCVEHNLVDQTLRKRASRFEPFGNQPLHLVHRSFS